MATEHVHWIFGISDRIIDNFVVYHFKTKTYAERYFKMFHEARSETKYPLTKTTTSEYLARYQVKSRVAHSYPEGKITSASHSQSRSKNTEYMWQYTDKSGNVYSLSPYSKVVDGEYGDIGFFKTMKQADDVKKTYIQYVKLGIVEGPKIPFKLVKLN